MGRPSPAMHTIGTAGHVDHGKSSLIKALTGIDPDRLPEEKAREMTIDLGFAWLKLPSGVEVSIVDVPGHERFVHNMLAGVGGIDLALLVVAADEGVMPQTREHLAILDLLEISRGVVALTKKDLMDEEWLELARLEVEETLRGTSLEGAPVVACSSVTGEGLDELLRVLERELARTPPRQDLGRPRLPIDRAFSLPGFGTVVTGTLVDGTLALGQEVEIVPAGLRSRVRGLQSHGRPLERASPGRRTAVNLPGIAVDELERGMVLTVPGWLRPTTAVDVRLRAVPYLRRPVRHNLEVTFHSGAAEVPGRLLLLDADEVPPGGVAWAQVRLARPVACLPGDHFVVRDPNGTLGGGRIVDVHARRHRRHHRPTLELLARLESGAPRERLLVALAAGPTTLREAALAAGLSLEQARGELTGLLAEGRVVALGAATLAEDATVASQEALQGLLARAREALAAYHRQWPLRRGMPREELRSRLGVSQRTFDAVVAHWAGSGVLREEGGAVALPEHRPTPSPEQRRRAEEFLAALRATPFHPPSPSGLEQELLSYLEAEGQVVRVSPEVVFAADAYQEMVRRVTEAIGRQGSVTLAQVRDLLGTSRKYAQALLEHLDAQGVTVRRGDERVLRRPS
ncbi:MAG TPA: selenocysteine-specific translation elongation factor [Dehalococcoidia bacterium]|nr:selenocysteine-specific translation elongation factor [Dehalococcoidia bacterium]